MASSPSDPYSEFYYSVHFDGELIQTLVTGSCLCVDRWISDIYYLYRHDIADDGLVVGLDCKSLPSSIAGITHPIAVMQLCVNDRCLIFQIMYADAMPIELVRFLNDERITFAGAAAKENAEKLKRDYGLRVACAVDVADMAALIYDDHEFRGMGLLEMAFTLLGEKMKKRSLSDWDNRFLTYSHVEYACVHAYMSYFLGMFILSFDDEEETKRR
ncbi:Werner Syndrome-like exonuclease, partial [Neltuma alba]|uniref:Werner Syndrome-like exonuclease n=1 Tax=Neltuma alba TaxID=207710 RepID=UPI0010A32205